MICEDKIKIYDIIIVGGGPAGSNFARLTPKSLNVLLLLGNKKQKPCGGLLAPDTQKVLACFDLNLPKDILVDPQIFSVRTIDLSSKIQKWYRRMYLNVDRQKFDNWLISLIPERVERSNGTCIKVERTGVGFKVIFKEESGDIKTVFCKKIVGADGANSIVRRSLGKKIKTRKYVAIQQWFKEEEKNIKPFYSCIFDSYTSDCCSWTVSKNGHIIFGGAFNPVDCRKNFEAQKEKLKNVGIILGKPLKTEACMVLRPINQKSFCCGDRNVFLIGEAAGFISPSSLEGISSAIISGVALAKAFVNNRGDILKQYKKNTLKIRIKLSLKNFKCPFMYNSFLRNIVMKSKVFSLKMENQREI